MITPNINAQFVTMEEKLADYDFTVAFLQAAKHTNAKSLSYPPDRQPLHCSHHVTHQQQTQPARFVLTQFSAQATDPDTVRFTTVKWARQSSHQALKWNIYLIMYYEICGRTYSRLMIYYFCNTKITPRSVCELVTGNPACGERATCQIGTLRSAQDRIRFSPTALVAKYAQNITTICKDCPTGPKLLKNHQKPSEPPCNRSPQASPANALAKIFSSQFISIAIFSKLTN